MTLIGVGSGLWAALCTVVLDLSTIRHQPAASWYGFLAHPGPSLVSAALMWLVIVLLICVTNRLWLSFGLSLGLCAVVSVASVAKYSVRDEPLYPSDLLFLWQPSFLLEMASPGSLVLGSVGLLVLVVGLVLVGRRLDRRFPRVRRRTESRAWTRILVARVAGAAIVALVLIEASQFNAAGNRVRATYEASGAEWLLWRQGENYFENGFVAAFLFNTFAGAMDEPKGYSRAAMGEIASRYRARAEQLNADRRPDALADVNVVLLLSEAFSDPLRLSGVELAEDPIPVVRRIMASHPSGQAVGNATGGGTANMEFEALTGMSQVLFSPQLSTPFQMLVPAHDQFPSAAWYFAKHGHETLAVHPFLRTMYRRNAAYPRLGFDTFFDVRRLKGLSTIGDTWAWSDESTYREAIRLLKGSEAPVFMNLVTLQNHYPYEGVYEDPIENNLRNDALGQYARGLAHADQATGRLLDELARSGERTLVIFYGDHLPGAVYDDDVILANVERRTETPFFLWSSFRDLAATRLPVTSPIFFMPLAFEALGAKVPPYYALLSDLHDEVPNLSLGHPIDPAELSTRARTLLNDLRLVQYDFSVGQRYAVDEMFHPLP
jgi:phosphoglycerol transferase MdoB-like AlkP superfamily enzyme